MCRRNASEPSRGKGKTTRRGSTTNGERERETENNTLAAILTAPYANPGHPVCSIVVREPENRRATAALSLGLNCVSRVRALLLRTQVGFMFSHTYTPTQLHSCVTHTFSSPIELFVALFVLERLSSRFRVAVGEKLTATGGSVESVVRRIVDTVTH